jgi:hypothetical protein
MASRDVALLMLDRFSSLAFGRSLGDRPGLLGTAARDRGEGSEH